MNGGPVSTEDIVRRFLSAVVVIDDQPVYEMPELGELDGVEAAEIKTEATILHATRNTSFG